LSGWHILSGACCLSGLVIAIASPHAQQPTFKAGVELVTVPVTVTSLDHNTYIPGLAPADFRLTENGDRQEVTVVTRERVPVSVSMVIDSSANMAISNRRYLAIEAAQQVVAALQPEDEVSIIFVAKTIEQKLPWTRVKAIKELNFDGWNPIGGAPLNDGIRAALTLIETANNQRHAVILMTPGIESSSRTSVTQLVKTREQSEAAIYGFGLGSFRAADQASENPRVMRLNPNPGSAELRKVDELSPGSMKPQTSALAEIDPLETLVGDSGGTVTRLMSLPEASMAARNVAADLGNQYLVGYTPKKSLDGKYRRLKVEVNRKGLYVRHRGGYLALPLLP
jgi:Ca-activated chloride channel family protein